MEKIFSFIYTIWHDFFYLHPRRTTWVDGRKVIKNKKAYRRQTLSIFIWGFAEVIVFALFAKTCFIGTLYGVSSVMKRIFANGYDQMTCILWDLFKATKEWACSIGIGRFLDTIYEYNTLQFVIIILCAIGSALLVASLNCIVDRTACILKYRMHIRYWAKHSLKAHSNSKKHCQHQPNGEYQAHGQENHQIR